MRIIVGIIALGLATSVQAEVVKAEPAGFETAATVTIAAPPQVVWDTLRSPTKWWNAEHTYSGDAKNLYIDSQATGCFCEKIPGDTPTTRGSVEHARIVYSQPPKMLRLQGALGPLQAEAVTGTMTFTLTPEGAGATKVTLTYVVGGYIRGGAEKIAPLVDKVMTLQLDGLKAAAVATPPAT
ncbi:SRPBCC family protein [Sphingomonas sp. SUN019]|uniref:SRPBCC family protein n=1 Tax=Sphingomonas sp. SUN019 TaxID=2937788 RepID=UPI00216430EA|nr:SRPBCC family protein [Sphingomonas sp. SUN019]UVO49743.1 SRPBCC family protein [Sphingomonas sp. SUN019]